jgi:hypothetical protein
MNKASSFIVHKLKRVMLSESDVDNVLTDLNYCQFINETICEVSQVRSFVWQLD